MADKNLKISLKSDVRDGQKLLRFVNELHQTVEKLAKKLGNINIGGGMLGPSGQPAPGRVPLGKQLEGDKRGMEAMGRAVDDLSRKFDRLNTSVAKVSQTMGGGGLVDQFGRPVSSGSPGGGGGPPGPPPPGGPPGGPPGPPGTPPGPGGGGGIWGRLTQPVGGVAGMMGRMLGWGTILNNLQEGFFGGPQRAIDWASLGGRSGSEAAGGLGTMGARLLGGDMSPALGLQRLMGGGHGGTQFSRGDFEEIINASPDQALRMAQKKGLSLNLVKSWNEVGQGLDPRARAAKMSQLYAGFIQQGIEQSPMEDARLSYARGVAPGRVGFARRYGKDFSAGTALGNVVDPQQVMSTVSAVLDVLGTGANINKVTRVVTEATRLGLSSEAIQTMMRAQEMGGGNLMERVLRSGLSRPMMGRAGAAAAGMAGDSLMRLNPDSFIGGFTAGRAGTDELRMRQLQGGASFLGQVTSGGLDPYQATINMALATKKGRSVFTTGIMGKMSLPELMQAASKSGPTAEQRAMGITAESARELLNSEINSLTSRAFGESGVEQPAAIKRLLSAQESEGGLMGEAARLRKMGRKGEQGLTELNAGLAAITGQQLGSRPLDFILGAGEGRMGDKATSSSGRWGPAYESTMAGAREMEKDPFGRMTLAMKDLRAVIDKFPETIKEFDNSLQTLDPDTMKSTAISLAGLGSAMGEIAKKGPDAVKVLDHVAEVAERLSKIKAAEVDRTTVDYAMQGGIGP